MPAPFIFLAARKCARLLGLRWRRRFRVTIDLDRVHHYGGLLRAFATVASSDACATPDETEKLIHVLSVSATRDLAEIFITKCNDHDASYTSEPSFHQPENALETPQLLNNITYMSTNRRFTSEQS